MKSLFIMHHNVSLFICSQSVNLKIIVSINTFNQHFKQNANVSARKKMCSLQQLHTVEIFKA